MDAKWDRFCWIDGKHEVSVPDIPSIARMTNEEYREFVSKMGFFHVDHHEVLRESHVAYGIAVTQEQLDIFISELEAIRDRLIPESKLPSHIVEAREKKLHHSEWYTFPKE